MALTRARPFDGENMTSSPTVSLPLSIFASTATMQIEITRYFRAPSLTKLL